MPVCCGQGTYPHLTCSRHIACVALQTLPLQYCQARGSLWQQLQAACAKLQAQSSQLPHAAFVLLDQAAAVGLWDAAALEPNSKLGIPQAWLLAACVVLAAQAAAVTKPAAAAGASAGAGSLLEADVAEQFGVTLDDVLLGVALVREKCATACRGPIVTAYDLVEVYLEALLAGQLDRKVRRTACTAGPRGHGGGQQPLSPSVCCASSVPADSCPLCLQVPPASLIGEALALAGHASSHLSSLGMPASQLAALLVVAGRQSRGLHPVWPKVLVVLTGMMGPVDGAQQQFLQELVVRAATLRYS